MGKVLLEELRLARKCVADGALAEAQRHIGIALRLYEAAPIGAIPPTVGNVILWAERAMEGADVAVVLMALDEAVRVLEEGVTEGLCLKHRPCTSRCGRVQGSITLPVHRSVAAEVGNYADRRDTVVVLRP
jgi:hypothetical protein